MPESVAHTPQSRGRPHAYPWSKWIEDLIRLPIGQALRFTQGIDFDCSAETFRSNWYRQDQSVLCNIAVQKQKDKPERVCVFVSVKKD